MCVPDQLAVSDGSESDAASGEPDDEPEPYRPVLTDEERLLALATADGAVLVVLVVVIGAEAAMLVVSFEPEPPD